LRGPRKDRFPGKIDEVVSTPKALNLEALGRERSERTLVGSTRNPVRQRRSITLARHVDPIFSGSINALAANSGCAARSWALRYNDFGVPNRASARTAERPDGASRASGARFGRFFSLSEPLADYFLCKRPLLGGAGGNLPFDDGVPS
jgi:hypothetical protein